MGRVLRAGERKMLAELVAIYPQALTREELGERRLHRQRRDVRGLFEHLPAQRARRS
jgi:hypothetical protein